MRDYVPWRDQIFEKACQAKRICALMIMPDINGKLIDGLRERVFPKGVQPCELRPSLRNSISGCLVMIDWIDIPAKSGRTGNAAPSILNSFGRLYSPAVVGLASWLEWLDWSHECYAAIDTAEGVGTVHRAGISTIILNDDLFVEDIWGDIAETWKYKPPGIHSS